MEARLKTTLLAILTATLAGCPAPTPSPRRPVERPRSEVYRPYQFTLNGKPFQPKVLSESGEPSRPRPGDAVQVGSVWLRLGENRRCHFVTQKDRTDRVLLRQADGSLRLVGLQVSKDLVGDSYKVIDKELTSLPSREVRALWGLKLDGWSPGVARQLRHLDAGRICLAVTQEVGQGPKRDLPSMPRGLRCLIIDESSSEGLGDLRALAQLTDLRILMVHRVYFPSTDLRLLGRLSQLRYLGLCLHPIKHLAALASLTALRELDLSHASGLTHLKFVRGMRNLRRLDIENTKVADLRPIAGLTRLQTVRANGTPLRRLPMANLPRLHTLRVMSTKVARSSVQGFRRFNPRCRVWFGWADAFRRSTRGTTRIRVRAGGTCHGDAKREKTLADIRDAREISSVLSQLQIEEPGSQVRCMCCGYPRIEFYRGSKLLVTLGVQHGRALRWRGGWPGDAQLTSRGSDFLVRWLARRGAPEALRERQLRQRQAKAMKRRVKRYRQLLPPATWRALQVANGEAQILAALRSAAKTPTARAGLFLRLFGCHDDTWSVYSGYDRLLSNKLLPGLKALPLYIHKIVRLSCIMRHMGGKMRTTDWRACVVSRLGYHALRGAARWVFDEGRAARMLPKLGQKRFLRLARVGLTSPRRANQHRVLHALATHLKRSAIPLLRLVYQGRLRPRRAPVSQQPDPPGWVKVSTAESLCGPCSARSLAAYFLGKLGDRTLIKSLPSRIQAATGYDKKLYRLVLRMLTKKKPR